VAPTAADLDDPLGYVDRFMSGATRDEMDTALDALLSESASGEQGDEQDKDEHGGSEDEGHPGKA
jgi:hypothetical protein